MVSPGRRACAGVKLSPLMETRNPAVTVSLPCGRSGRLAAWCLPFSGGAGA